MPGFPAVIDLSNLGSYGFRIQADGNSLLGGSISSAGDVNDDGIDDIIIGGRLGTTDANLAGNAYVIFGSTAGFGTIDLAYLPESLGFMIRGDAFGDQLGTSVSGAGDVNGDGIDDMIVGAPYGDDGGTDAGEAYVIFGSTTGFGTLGGGERVLSVSTLSAAQGFVIQGDASDDRLGQSVSNAGDVNGDGIDDIIVGATLGDDGGINAGEAYVIFGSTSGFGSPVGGRQVIDLTSLTPAQGFIIQGDSGGDNAGRVSNAGDINDDGIDDLIVGAPDNDDGGNDSGGAYVIFGSTSGFGSLVGGRQVLDLTTFTPAEGFIIRGDINNDLAGHSVSNAGDVNGDGIDDLIVGAQSGDDGGSSAGEAYVVYGSTSGFGSPVGGQQVLDLTTLTPAQGFIIQGDAAGDRTGFSVSNAGDVNGDGIDDLIVGAPHGDDGGIDAGEAYVVYGSNSGFGSLVGGRQVLDLSTLTPAQGFIIQGDAAQDEAGTSVSAAGDLNDDGFDDLIVGVPLGDDATVWIGEAYVIWGRGASTPEPPTVDLDASGAGTGFASVFAEDGTSAAIADSDVAITASGGQIASATAVIVNPGAGDALTVSGSLPPGISASGIGTTSLTLSGTASAAAYQTALAQIRFTTDNPNVIGTSFEDTLTGTAGPDTMFGFEENDFLYGLGNTATRTIWIAVNDGTSSSTAATATVTIADTLFGGSGNDYLNGGAGVDAMYGGAGDDSYDVDDSRDTVTEAAGEGQDIVYAHASFALAVGSEIEILVAMPSASLINLTGNELANVLYGNDRTNVLSGGDGNDVLEGFGGNDTLIGGLGNDYLDGGSGIDTMAGGAGNDIYRVDNGSDVVTDVAGEGTDTVYTTVGYTLNSAAEIEVLAASTAASINLTGNDFANEIHGNNAANILNSANGGDRLFGYDGGDRLYAGSGDDFLDGGNGNDGLEGFAGGDTLIGGAGNDYLDGGTGADAMSGGEGDDTYWVDNAGDSVNESSGGGNDKVFARGNYTLTGGAHVELLSAGVAGAMNLTGNELANAVYGNDSANLLVGGGGNDAIEGFGGADTLYGGNDSDYIDGGADNDALEGFGGIDTLRGGTGADYLDGGAGADAMIGGAGNDTYRVDDAGDVVTEAAGEGQDIVFAIVSYTLAAGSEVETLAASGDGAFNLTGNELANALYGNNDANVLDGGGGDDVLAGFGGADTYAFTTALGAGNVDRILGFVSATDKIALDDAVFTALPPGALAPGAFVTGSAAADGDDRIVYDSATGALYYDADGNGAGTAVQFAILDGAPPLAASDFFVI